MEQSIKRVCWICKTEYPLDRDHFYKDSKDKSGFQKRCIECNKKTNKRYIEKNPDYFPNKGKERYHNEKSINPNYNKNRYSKYKEQYLKYRKDWKLTEYGRIYDIFSAAKSRSLKKKIPFDLTFEDVIKMYHEQDNKCALTGLALITNEQREEGIHYYPFAPSIDKIDPSKGYVLGNIRIVAVITNLALNGFGDRIFDQMCRAYIEKNYNIKI